MSMKIRKVSSKKKRQKSRLGRKESRKTSVSVSANSPPHAPLPPLRVHGGAVNTMSGNGEYDDSNLASAIVVDHFPAPSTTSTTSTPRRRGTAVHRQSLPILLMQRM